MHSWQLIHLKAHSYSRGVRPTARGGHWVVADLLAVVDGVEVHVVSSLNRLRILRNEIEYPQSVSMGVTREVVQLAFETSQATIAVPAHAEEVQIVVGDADSGLGLAIVAQFARCLPQSGSENLVVLWR